MANETWWSYYDNMNNTGGGGGGGVTVLTEDENGALNMTWEEINELPFAVLKRENIYEDGTPGMTDILLLTRTGVDTDSNPAQYTVMFGNIAGDIVGFTTDSPNGYPTHQDDGGGEVS